MRLKAEVKKNRKTRYSINPLILNRWSPRAFSGEKLPDKELLPLFEAARWAPSSFNHQPWRFIVAKRETPEWKNMFSVMNKWNKSWAVNASALMLLISHKTFEYKHNPSRTHSMDSGTAMQNLSLEATTRGLIVHGMEGFDYAKARRVLKVPKDYQIEALYAIGKRGKKSILPEALQKKETPNTRLPLKQLVFKGHFGRKYIK